MQPVGSSHRWILERAIAVTAVLALMLAGALPALHQHDTEALVAPSDHPSASVAAHLHEALDLEDHGVCTSCAKMFSSVRQSPLVPLIDERATIGSRGGVEILPQGLPGRDGASRAPPAA